MLIKKQVYELKLDDFEKSPVWEFALNEEGVEGQDDATVRPFEVSGALDPGVGMFIVKAKFILADGSEFGGYLTPPGKKDTGNLGIIQPVLLTTAGYITFWNGIIKPDTEELKGNYAKLNKTSAEIFPIKFSSEVEIAGGPIAGELTGFLYVNSETGFFSGKKEEIAEIK